MPSNEAPKSPTQKITYAFSANRTIVQHADTVRYITGCTAAPPIDTTFYILYGADSVRRVSPTPRTFDRMMVTAIRSDMASAMLRQRVKRNDPEMANVPGPPKWPCDLR